MKSILEAARQILEAGGQSAGSMELVKISPSKAREYAEMKFEENKRDLDEEIPNFDKNFVLAQEKASMGKTQRKDMPVIDTDDVKDLQQRLKDGKLDLNKPFAKTTNPSDPFPEGLSGWKAKDFLERGKQDGEEKDDQVNYRLVMVPVGKLKPIQKQVYFDKSIDATAANGAEGTSKFLSSKSILIASNDLFIIDGHHRFLSGVILNPNLKVPVLMIELPIDKLLPLSLAYGDALGNKRNA